MINRELEQQAPDVIYKAAIKSEIVDIDDLNIIYNPNFHLAQIDKVQVLGNVLLSDEHNNKLDLQNILGLYEIIRFKMELYKTIELKKTQSHYSPCF